MTILITRPRHDEATNYLYFWTSPVIEEIKKKPFRLIDLTSGKANNKLFNQYFSKLKPSFIFLNGHGSAEAVAGHNNEILLKASDVLTKFGGSMFYCRSCEAALILGPALITAGVRGFIGYRRKFVVGYILGYSTHPIDDPLAKLFLVPSNVTPLSLIKGHSLGDAYLKSQLAMRANLRKMLSSTASFEERYYAQFLWSNIKWQTILGDPDSKI